MKTPDILFDPDGVELSPSTKDSLKLVADFLRKNKKLAVELGFHTDYKNTAQYDEVLTVTRAKIFTEYLTKDLGIPSLQIVPNGYGKSHPTYAYSDIVLPSKKILKKGTRLNQQLIDVNYPPMKSKEDYEFLMKMNRRMELKVLSTEYGKYKTLKDSVFEVGDIIKMPLILYTMDKYDLADHAKDSLNEVVDFLKKHPNMQVELGVHSDYRVPEEYNTALTKNRAKVCVDYIINEKKIPMEQIVPMGYGEIKPLQLPFSVILPSGKMVYSWTVLTETWIDKNYPAKLNKDDYEFLMQLNRRTELKVLSINFGK